MGRMQAIAAAWIYTGEYRRDVELRTGELPDAVSQKDIRAYLDAYPIDCNTVVKCPGPLKELIRHRGEGRLVEVQECR